jgi:GT2 family glycosyltransferase
LDEDYFLYWEDADFSLRAKNAGFKCVVVPASQIFHFEKSEKKREQKLYWLVVSGLIFFKKNTPWKLRAWVRMYLYLRKVKNWLDTFNKENKEAFAVQKAYKDFRNAKF